MKSEAEIAEEAYASKIKGEGQIPYYDMDQQYIFDSISVRCGGKSGYRKIKDFDGFDFKSWTMDINAHTVDDDNEISRDTHELMFVSTFVNPVQATRELLDYVEVSLYIDGLKNKLWKSITTDLVNITTADVSLFMQIVRPDRTEVSIKDLTLIDEYRYLHYQNLKWANEVLVSNIHGWISADGFPEFRAHAFASMGVEDSHGNKLLSAFLRSDAKPVIESVIAKDQDSDIAPTALGQTVR